MRKKLFKSESKRLLDLMINAIYTNKEIFLREIISNASDALDKLHYISLTDENARAQCGELKININFDKDSRTITVSDNGVGMTAQELEENLGTIAKSGSLKFKEEMDKKDRDENDIIGQFGVGFYSAFMVSKDLTVISRSYKEETANIWKSEGASGYTINEGERETVGTDIIMHLKDDTDTENYSEFLSEYKLKNLIKTYSDYIRYPIEMPVEKRREVGEGEDKTTETYIEIETINSMIPIWQRSKKDAPDEECFKFYKDKFYDFNDPVSVIRINADGLVSYKAMLFIPSKTPYDYYTKEYKKGLALYQSGVMIMENCEDLLPEHLRFVKGVVDTNDLSLNISREMLQQSHELKVIATNIEKKVRAELKRLMDKEWDKYLTFWNAFGLQLKYGIVSDYGIHKDNLSDLLLFYSEKEDKLITLKSYSEAMSEEQKNIYYSCADSVSAAKNAPLALLAKEKGFDVLLLTDEVDEFVVKTLMTYAEKPIISVNEENNGLVSDEDKKKVEEKAKESCAVLEFIKEKLGDKISEATLKGGLNGFAVSLGTKGGITLEMEKYFAAMPGENHPKAQRVLELNPEHSAFKAIESLYKTQPETAEKYVKILYGEALLAVGLPLEDPFQFCNLVSELIK
jgi:molecular chaperone HtpG